MRLTLRTLLAYMDDILDPADSQDIGKKVEESEFATNLMHRIRDVTRRLRLAAPKLEGRGIGLDPNTVAEYLDNMLSSERVGDFEKVCLESDVHLAEVASAHQILALVLAEPAEVDAPLKAKMYQVPELLAQSPVVAPAAATSVPLPSHTPSLNDPPEIRTARQKPEVPEYLREKRPRRYRKMMVPAAVVLLLLACGAGIAAMQWGLLPSLLPQQLAQMLPGPQPQEEPAAPNPAPEQTSVKTAKTTPPEAAGLPSSDRIPAVLDRPLAEAQPTTSPALPKAVPPTTVPASGPPSSNVPGPSPSLTPQPSISPPSAVAGSANAVPAVPTPAPAGVPIVAPAVPGGSPAVAASAVPAALPGPGGLPSMPAAAPQGPPAVFTGPAGNPAQPTPGVAAVVPAPPGAIPAGQPGLAPPPVPGPVIPIPPVTSIAGVTGTNPPTSPAAVPQPPAVAAAMTNGIGRMISDHEVVLRFDRDGQTWQRLATRATVFPGYRLLCLPTYRATLTLGPGISVQAHGSTTVDLLAPTSQDVPGIALAEGRLMVLPLGKADAQVLLRLSDHEFSVVFADPDSTLALEVHRQRIDGTNPEKEPGPIGIDVYATAGTIRWNVVPNKETAVLKAPAHVSMIGDQVRSDPGQFSAQDYPDWIKNPDDRPQIEKRASEAVEEALETDRPISLGLKELAGHRRVEVSSLAVQCLAEIDDFDAFVTSLNDSAQHASWNAQVDSLRAAIARGPATATRVREALERHRGPKGTELYRMLWGYTSEQLQAGAATQLVKYLDHEDLDFRVLSFWNLSRIAGSTHFYRPEFTPAKRATAVRTWKTKLDSGQLFLKSTDGRPAEK